MTDEAKARPGARPIPRVPTSTALDKLRDVGIASAAAVPALLTHLPVAGPIAVILNAVLGQPTSKRWTDWAEAIGETVLWLVEERGVPVEALADNPDFQNAARRATEAAMKDARREKWELLRNALMNSVLPPAPADEIQQLFFRYVDEFSPTHVRVLRLCIEYSRLSPLEYQGQAATPLGDFMRRSLPQPPPDPTVLRIFLEDLAAKGLLTSSLRSGSISNDPLGRVSLTDLGRDFIRFFSAPSAPSP